MSLGRCWCCIQPHWLFHPRSLSFFQILTSSEQQPQLDKSERPLNYMGLRLVGGTTKSICLVTFPPIFSSSSALRLRELRVVLGTNSLISPSLDIKGVTRIILHKDFQRSNMNNDIALLLLDTPIVFNNLKKPICMPKQPGPSTWHQCWVTGWGQIKTGTKEPMETELMKVPMTIVDWGKCLKQFPKLTKNMLCAGYQNESYDACQGDSGGPLACTTQSDKRWYQVGIISWGRSCGQKNTPGIYTSLENYTVWIKNVTEMEGRPYSVKKIRVSLKEKPKSSRASQFLEPESPRFWLQLCLLLSMLLKAIFYG
uniref:Peptidase S1 domain-containing protein n=1 Tax=Sus scrofa TaxID=9823 RepID=A0A8D1CPV8_PIG